MANLCSAFVTISGNKETLEDLLDRIVKQDSTLLSASWYLTDVGTTMEFGLLNYEELKDRNDDLFEWKQILLSLCCRGAPPTNQIEILSRRYPDLTFHVQYEEGGNQLFGEMSIEDGNTVEDIEYTEPQYLEKFDDDYISEKNKLYGCTYHRFLKEYTHDNFFDEHPYTYLDRNVVARIKDKDLPLFINRQWGDANAEVEYKRRLAGEPASTKEPK